MTTDDRSDDRADIPPDADRPDPSRARDHDRGYGRDPNDRNPGAHVDYYRGGDRGQPRTGPEGGFESREDFRRSDDHADQGKSEPGDQQDEPAPSPGNDE